MVDEWSTLNGRSVLVTGHTGFKGSWLTLWLSLVGARVTGYALDPSTTPNHFEAAGIAPLMSGDVRGDIRDSGALTATLAACAPDVIFHLAAQPIVQQSLVSPRETFEVNVIGTSALLDAVRAAAKPCVVIVVTSDKCYRNDGQIWGFRENDPLGGHDPYSASKAACELVVDAYRSSFFPIEHWKEHGIRLASVRAGNVIGGGDWASDRIVPDAVRALSTREDLIVRNPASTRPWQHVLEPLSGYLSLAARLLGDDNVAAFAQAWNFGPLTTEEASVGDLASAIVKSWGTGQWVAATGAKPNVEAPTLRISIDKAVSALGWRPRWDFAETVHHTVEWYRNFYEDRPRTMQARSIADITDYQNA